MSVEEPKWAEHPIITYSAREVEPMSSEDQYFQLGTDLQVWVSYLFMAVSIFYLVTKKDRQQTAMVWAILACALGIATMAANW